MKIDETITYYPVCEDGYVKHIQTAHTMGKISKKELSEIIKNRGCIIVDNYEKETRFSPSGELCGIYLNPNIK